MKLIAATALFLASTSSLWAIDAKVTSQYAAPYTISPGTTLEVENTVRVSKTISNAVGTFVLLDDADKAVYTFPAGSFGTFGVGARSISANTVLPATVKDGSYRLRFEMSGNGAAAELVGKQFSEYLRIIVRKGAPNTAAVNLLPKTPLANPTRLTFNDNFNNGLNRSYWTPGMAVAGVPNPEELEWYTPDEVAPMGGGMLRLNVHKRDFLGKHYTAGAITSAEGFAQTFGHFEARLKMPAGAGTWPAFWLLPVDGSWPPEIDIFEELGRQPTVIYTTAHALVNGVHQQSSAGTDTKLLASAEYHVYAVDWRPEAMVFSIDGKEVYRVTDKKMIPTKPMYMLLNVAMGGSWAGPVDQSMYFPGMMDIDYVRVFQYADMKAEPVRPLQLGKSNLSKRNVNPGDTVTLSGSLRVGDKPLKSVQTQAYITGFTGDNWMYAGNAWFGDVTAGKTLPFNITVKVPATLAPGIYNISVLGLTDTAVVDPVNGQPVKQVSRALADQLVVGTPVTPNK